MRNDYLGYVMTDFDARAREIVANAGAAMLRTGLAQSANEEIAAALKAAYNEGLEDVIKATGMGGLGCIAVRAKKVPT